MNSDTWNRLYAARRRRNAIMMTLAVGATLLGLGWLVVILGELFWQGFSGLSLAVFTEMTPPPGADGIPADRRELGQRPVGQRPSWLPRFWSSWS